MKKTWLTKKKIEKATISLRWDPDKGEFFKIIQDLHDSKYYLQHAICLLQRMVIEGCNSRDLETVGKMLIMAKIMHEDSLCSGKLSTQELAIQLGAENQQASKIQLSAMKL